MNRESELVSLSVRGREFQRVNGRRKVRIIERRFSDK